jgi:hypothetical protein
MCALHFREHHFILLLPAISLLTGVAVSSAAHLVTEWTNSNRLVVIPIAVFLIAFAAALITQRKLLLEMDPISATRALYSVNPFPEALEVGNYLHAHSRPSDTIAVLGSEPEIYFYAKRHSATGYIYTYSLMEDQPYAVPMQRELISEIEAMQPRFVVLVNIPTSWLVRPTSEHQVMSWAQQYVEARYDVVGIADLQSNDHTEFRWGPDASRCEPASAYSVYVFCRRN